MSPAAMFLRESLLVVAVGQPSCRLRVGRSAAGNGQFQVSRERSAVKKVIEDMVVSGGVLVQTVGIRAYPIDFLVVLGRRQADRKRPGRQCKHDGPLSMRR
jgi:hypothetical protein